MENKAVRWRINGEEIIKMHGYSLDDETFLAYPETPEVWKEAFIFRTRKDALKALLEKQERYLRELGKAAKRWANRVLKTRQQLCRCRGK